MTAPASGQHGSWERMFENMAARIRAGDTPAEVLHDFGSMAAHPPNADHAGRSTDAGVSSSNPGAQARCRPDPNADGPSADALSADDHRLLAMLRGEWNNEADGYWPAVDAMDEAARVIDRLAARLAETQAKHTANHDAWLDEVVRLKRELSEAPPRDPTDAMVNAGAYEDIRNIGDKAVSPYDHARNVWRVMWDAAMREGN